MTGSSQRLMEGYICGCVPGTLLQLLNCGINGFQVLLRGLLTGKLGNMGLVHQTEFLQRLLVLYATADLDKGHGAADIMSVTDHLFTVALALNGSKEIQNGKTLP